MKQKRTSKMFRFFLTSAILWVVGFAAWWNSPSSVFGLLQIPGLVGVGIVLLFCSVRIGLVIKRRLLWTVRNKIIVSFAFVGILPVLILLILGWLTQTMIFQQLSVLYLENELSDIQRTLDETLQQVLLEHYSSIDRRQDTLESRLQEVKTTLSRRLPGLDQIRAALFRRHWPDSLQLVYSDPGWKASIPDWIEKEFSGLVMDASSPYFRAITMTGEEHSTYVVGLEIPFDDELIDHIYQRTAIEVRLTSSNSEFQSAISDFFGRKWNLYTITWAHLLSITDWESGVEARDGGHPLVLSVPLARLYEYFFAQSGTALLIFFLALGVIFLLVELFSLLIGLVIAKSITGSIHDIYQGTQQIQMGHFDYRIPERRQDQLGSVASAFNKMGLSIVQLMKKAAEKERLDKEIEIARQVQKQLSLQETPKIQSTELSAICVPARHISGDYYDFIPDGDGRLDLVIGDISGKGISAALLMASLQSSIRSRVSDPGTGGSGGIEQISSAVSEVNKQLYATTAADKFATLVFSRFDARNLTLTYCNAGHNPPFIVSKGSVRKMTAGGMVAGLFEHQSYEEEQIALKEGDLIFYYTDGIVEAENATDDSIQRSV